MNSYVDEVVRKKIDDIEAGKNVFEMGRVRNVQSYMLEISGMENAAYFDRVIIESPGAGQVAEGYVDRIKTLVQNKIHYSREVQQTDYFNYLAKAMP